MVGETLGQLLGAFGHKEEARTVLGRSAEAYRKLGRDQEAEQVEATIRDIDAET